MRDWREASPVRNWRGPFVVMGSGGGSAGRLNRLGSDICARNNIPCTYTVESEGRGISQVFITGVTI